MKNYKIQLADHRTGKIIQDAGGAVYVAVNGANTKETLTDKDGASLTNPVALTNGQIDFWVGDSVNYVDLYIQGPNGHFVVLEDVGPSGPNEIYIDQGQKVGTMVIPFDIADTTAAVETDTGFDLPLNAVVQGDGAGVLVTDLDATETVDVGLLSSETGGDANGFLVALSVAAAGFIAGSVAATATLGAMLVNTFATTPQVNVPGRHVGDGVAESICYTASAGSDTVTGKIVLPYLLA